MAHLMRDEMVNTIVQISLAQDHLIEFFTHKDRVPCVYAILGYVKCYFDERGNALNHQCPRHRHKKGTIV